MTQRLYLMENEASLNKIGIARNPTKRKRQLELASGLKIKIIKCWITLDASARCVEQYLHRLYSRRRVQGEWFSHISKLDVDYCGYELLECNFDGTRRRE
jgi:hypothetical protein